MTRLKLQQKPKLIVPEHLKKKEAPPPPKEPTKYRINSIFPTFQGEGSYMGQRALFIRLAHCNLHCSWCDTEFNSFKPYTILELCKKIMSYGYFSTYVITGGEPTLNPVFNPLCNFLQRATQPTAAIVIESNGTLSLNKVLGSPMAFNKLFYTVSPKADAKRIKHPPYYVHPENWQWVREIKLVIDKDLRQRDKEKRPTKALTLMGELRAKTKNSAVTLSLSPEFNELKENVNFIFELIARSPAWRLSLQTHKFIGYE